jgi:hypothetical protein
VNSIITLNAYHNFLDFNAKLGREDIFKQITRNESLNEISIDNDLEY